MPHRACRSAAFAALLLAACSDVPRTRPADGDTVPAPAAEAASPATTGAEPLRSARDVTGHAWREVERDAEKGTWFVPAPGLALVFHVDEPAGGAAADEEPETELEIHPNHRVTADGRALAESSVLGVTAVRVEDGATVLELREGYRRAAHPADMIGTREVRVRISPVAGESGIYRWDFSYASPDPCAGVQPCVLGRPLWVGALGTRWFERPDPAEEHPLDQTEPGDESASSPDDR